MGSLIPAAHRYLIPYPIIPDQTRLSIREIFIATHLPNFGLFGPANFGALFGVMFLSHQVGAFLGAWLGGLSYQWNGSYSVGWISLIVVGAVAALLQLARVGDRERRRLAP